MSGSDHRLPAEAWIGLLGGDPRRWLLEAGEPTARFIALTELLDRPAGDPDALAARAAVLADPGTEMLLARLPDWEQPTTASGHQAPAFAPNLLVLLADWGVRAGDDSRVERMLDQMLAHQEPSGHFASFARVRDISEPVWGSLPCDAHSIIEVLARFGRENDPRTRTGLARMAADLRETTQGPAWRCLPHSASGWRGPGRKDDACPQVTLEALRTFGRLPVDRRPPGLLAAAQTSLAIWRTRAREQPYMFGHGRSFKTVKWPTFWYDVHAVLDALGRWRTATARSCVASTTSPKTSPASMSSRSDHRRAEAGGRALHAPARPARDQAVDHAPPVSSSPRLLTQDHR